MLAWESKIQEKHRKHIVTHSTNMERKHIERIGKMELRIISTANQLKIITAKNSKQKAMLQCQECEKQNCMQLRAEEIKTITSSVRSNGALYNKIKFQDGHTEWHFSCKISGQMLRVSCQQGHGWKEEKESTSTPQFFFTAAASSVSAVSGQSDQDSDKPKLLGMKRLEDRTYHLVKSGHAEWT